LFTKHCERPVEVLQQFGGKWLLFDEPGTQYRDSIYDWILVSAAVEATADQPFLKFMRERIFDPLGMRDTIPDPTGIEAGEDFPLVNMVRELIYDPEATRLHPCLHEEADPGPCDILLPEVRIGS
jgi:CubicO group peptidase (beta-lactamase class C family)